MLAKRIGLDLGTSNTSIWVPRRGIVVREPTVVARDVNSRQITAVGKAAQDMIGRTPEAIELFRPLNNGVIADYQATLALVKHFLSTALGRLRPLKPDIIINVPAGATSTERKAIIDVVLAAGGKTAYLIRESVAAALGAKISIQEAAGNMVIDIGGGTVEVAVLSLGGVVAEHSLRFGSNRIDAALADYLRRQHSLSVGDKTAETVKRRIGMALLDKKTLKMQVGGRDIVTGLPKTVSVASRETIEPIQESVEQIVLAIRSVLEKTPPELVSDIIDRGIVLTGGGAMLKNIDKLLIKVVGVPVVVGDDPINCGIKGIGQTITNLAAYQKDLLVQV